MYCTKSTRNIQVIESGQVDPCYWEGTNKCCRHLQSRNYNEQHCIARWLLNMWGLSTASAVMRYSLTKATRSSSSIYSNTHTCGHTLTKVLAWVIGQRSKPPLPPPPPPKPLPPNRPPGLLKNSYDSALYCCPHGSCQDTTVSLGDRETPVLILLLQALLWATGDDNLWL